MKITIEPGSVQGLVVAPPSKSMVQRAFAGALLHKGSTTISRVGGSDDELAAMGIASALGAVCNGAPSLEYGAVQVSSGGINNKSALLHCGESGLSARLFMPIAAVADVPMEITGHGTLLKRPMTTLVKAMRSLGVSVGGNDDVLPLTIKGPLNVRNVAVDGSDGSQSVSGLLFAFSACATEPVVLTVSNLKSRPYIDLTLDMLAAFGKPIRHQGYREFYIDPSQFASKENVSIDIEGDWSSAAFPLVAGAIAGSVIVSAISGTSRQADRAILGVLQDAGAGITNSDIGYVSGIAPLKAFDFDATHCPDLFPVLSILAACSYGDSSIRGVHRLFSKESNRVESIAEMLWAFGVQFSIEEDTLFVSSEGEALDAATIDSYNDHRIVMAAAVGALRARGPVVINDASAVTKSYPRFFEDMRACGMNWSEEL